MVPEVLGPLGSLERLAGGAPIKVTVVYSAAARQVTELELSLPADSCVLDALQASGLLTLHPDLAQRLNDGDAHLATVFSIGIWGRKTSLQKRLQNQDRVEIYRPLKVDPKVARRTRFAKQGAKTAGLFAQLRPGAKSGY